MRFRTRQSYYLRTGPYSSLQLVLYLDPAHVHWMSGDVLSRMLIALRERIPVQLRKEMSQSATSKTKQKNKIEVYRGTGYQIAFYFRKTSQKHVVLLKNRQFTAPPRAGAASSDSTSSSTKRERSEDAGPSSTATGAPPAAKRRAQAGSGEPEDDDIVFVKDEPQDEDFQVLHAGEDSEEGQDEFKADEFGDEGEAKPQLEVNYHGYQIFGKSLVVIIEPYPPLRAHERAQRRTVAPEIRQLSESVQPESLRESRHPSVFATGREPPVPRESMPPPPLPSATTTTRRSGASLFRQRSESVDTTLDTEQEEGTGEDGYKSLKAKALGLANDDSEDDDDLDAGPSLDELLRLRAQSAALSS